MDRINTIRAEETGFRASIPWFLVFLQFDESLRRQHEFYDHYRHVGTICQARVYLVRPGTFRELRELIIATSTASYNQFKMPKKLRTKATLNLMMENVTDGQLPA